MFSNEKDENVVSPPQKPTANKKYTLLTDDFPERNPTINPKIKQPTRLAISVA
jgi:hypothetical protein